MSRIDDLARRLDELERAVRSRTPQAARTTIVGGAIDQVETVDTGMVDEFGLPIYTSRVMSRFGRQADGTFTMVVLDGPTPPAPTGLSVTPGPGTLTVRWSGMFAMGVPAPQDFYAVMVHLAQNDQLGQVVLPSPATLAGSVVAKDGDGITIGGLGPEPYTVVLVTVAQSGKWSDPSEAVTATPDDGSGLAAVAQLNIEVANAVTKATDAAALADGKAATYFNTTAPDPALIVLSEGDLWFDTDDGNKLYRYSGSAWVVAQDQSAAQALSAAQAAQSDAADAALDASSALALAGTKITTYAQTAQPPVNTSKSGDLWIDTDDGNRLYRFNGTSWTDVRDSTIVSAQQTASQALTVAGQKGKTYSQGSAPNGSSTPPPITGDLWWDTTNYVLKQYNGSTWDAPAMDASQNIRSNTITAGLLATQLVLSTKIVAGPLNDAHAELDQYGLSLYQKRPDGTIVKTSSLGTPGTTDFIQVYDPNSGKSVASLNQDGRAVAASASLGTSPGSVVINGKTVESMFWPMPRGAVSVNYRGTNLAGVGATEQNWLEAQVFLERGRLFKVVLNPTYMLGSANGGIGWFVLRWAKNGAAVTSTSEQVQSAKMYLPLASEAFTSPPMTMIFSTAAQDTQFAEYRFLVTVRGSGAGTVTAVAGYSTPSILTIEDLGLDRADTGITSWATGSSRKQYVAYWQSGTVQNYNAATGAKVSAPVGHPTWQGFGTGTGNTYSSLTLFDGVSRAAWDDATPAMVGKTVAQALAGVPSSDIMSVEFNFLMAYSSTGYSVTVPFSAGNTLAMPATLTAPVAESSNITTPPGSWSAAVRMGNQRYDSVHFGDRNSANAGTWGYIEEVQMRVAFIK